MSCALLATISLTRIFIIVKVAKIYFYMFSHQPVMFHNLNHELIFTLESALLAVASFSYSSAWAFHYKKIDMGRLASA